MPPLISLCDSCGAVFRSRIIGSIEPGGTVKLSNLQESCPVCGEMARVPDGLYRAIGNTLEIIAGPKRTISDLEKIADVLSRAKDNSLGPQETDQLFRKELGEFSKIADLLPKTRVELYAFITMLLTAIGVGIVPFLVVRIPAESCQ